MKIVINSPNGYLEITSESAKDLFKLGKIAGNFKISGSNYPEGQMTVSLPLDKVLERLAE